MIVAARRHRHPGQSDVRHPRRPDRDDLFVAVMVVSRCPSPVRRRARRAGPVRGEARPTTRNRSATGDPRSNVMLCAEEGGGPAVAPGTTFIGSIKPRTMRADARALIDELPPSGSRRGSGGLSMVTTGRGCGRHHQLACFSASMAVFDAICVAVRLVDQRFDARQVSRSKRRGAAPPGTRCGRRPVPAALPLIGQLQLAGPRPRSSRLRIGDRRFAPSCGLLAGERVQPVRGASPSPHQHHGEAVEVVEAKVHQRRAWIVVDDALDGDFLPKTAALSEGTTTGTAALRRAARGSR